MGTLTCSSGKSDPRAGGLRPPAATVASARSEAGLAGRARSSPAVAGASSVILLTAMITFLRSSPLFIPRSFLSCSCVRVESSAPLPRPFPPPHTFGGQHTSSAQRGIPATAPKAQANTGG
eukprot:COSAG01_NODE_5945_length_3940_cov_3.383494_6_plen_121_part_00